MRRKKIAGKGIAAAVSCAMLVTSIPFGVYAADPNLNELPQPKFYFDMESIEGNRIVNQVTGNTYDVGGDTAESVSSIGKYGSALRFNGSQYVDLGTEFQPKNAYTMTGWIRQDAGATDGQAVFSRAWSGDIKDQLAMMVKGGQVYHAFSVGNGNRNFKEFFTNSAIKADKWEHVALTRDGSQIKVYVGGEEIYSGTDFSSEDFSQADKHIYRYGL